MKHYYLIPSQNFSGLSKMASILKKEACERYANCVISEKSLDEVADTLEQRAAQLHQEHTRCRIPTVELCKWDTATFLKIDDWAMSCYEVKNFIK